VNNFIFILVLNDLRLKMVVDNPVCRALNDVE